MSKLTADLLNKFAKCCQANEKYQPQNYPAKVFLLQLAQRNFSQVGTDKGDQQQPRKDECPQPFAQTAADTPPSEVAGLKLPITMKDRA